jgi:ribosomal protein L37AE/L43A
MWNRSRRKGVWCPVCRKLGLEQANFGPSWKCRNCGSRIPDDTLLTLIAEKIEIMRLKVAASEEEN